MTASAGGYSKNADTQFTAAWIEKKAPAPPPAPAPASNSTSPTSTSSGAALKNANSTSAPASVVTEQGNKVYDKDSSQQASSSEDKRLPASTDAAKQHQSGRKLLQASGPCEANIKVCGQ